MDCGCNCFGIAASSKRPVKRYNLLVPEIFPKQAPTLQKKLDASTERKFKKLYEYLEKNPGRGPKISRRLARRVQRGLATGQHGFVQIAVSAYVYLLARLREVGSSLVAKEVICQQVAKPTHFYQNMVPPVDCLSPRAESEVGSDLSSPSAIANPTGSPDQSVVGSLLGSSRAAMHILGARLLAAFIRQQVTAEYLTHIEALTERLSNIAVDTASQDVLGDEQIAILQAQQEYVRFCARTSASCRLIPLLADCSLPLVLQSRTSKEECHSTELVQSWYSGATELLRAMGQLSQGPSQGKTLLKSILQFVDKSGGWNLDGSPSNSPAIQLLKLASLDEQQQYTACSAMIHHAATSNSAPMARLSMFSTACKEAQVLSTVQSSNVLQLAVRDLHPWITELAADPSQHESTAIRNALLGSIQQMAGSLRPRQLLLEAMTGIAVKVGKPSAYPLSVLECIHASVLALQSFTSKEDTAEWCTLPPVLLQEFTILSIQGDQEQSLLAQTILQTIIAFQILEIKPVQIRVLTSTILHQVSMCKTVFDYVAMSHLISALVEGSQTNSLPDIALLASTLQDQVLRSDGHYNQVNANQRLATLLLAESVWNSLQKAKYSSGGANPLRLIKQTKALEIADEGLQAVCKEAAFEDSDPSDSSRMLIQLQEQYQSSRQEPSATTSSAGLSANAYFIPLNELVQRSRGHAASWFGGPVQPRTTDQEGSFSNSRNLRTLLTIKTRQKAEAIEDDREVQNLLQDIGLRSRESANDKNLTGEVPAVDVYFSGPQSQSSVDSKLLSNTPQHGKHSHSMNGTASTATVTSIINGTSEAVLS